MSTQKQNSYDKDGIKEYVTTSYKLALKKQIIFNSKGFTQLLLFSLILLLTESVFAQGNIASLDNTIEQMIKPVMERAATWGPELIRIATYVFWILVTVDWVLTFGYLALNGGDFNEFASALIRRVLFVSLGLWLLTNPDVIFNLVYGFRDAAARVGGAVTLEPSNIFDAGLKIMIRVWQSAHLHSQASNNPITMLALVMFISIATMAAWVTVAILELYVVIYAGVILLGFFGSQLSKEYAMRYIGYAFSVGVKLFMMQLFIAMVYNLLQSWYLTVGDTGNTTSSNLIAMTATTIVASIITMQIPSLIQSFISGMSGMGGIAGVRDTVRMSTRALGGGGMAGRGANMLGRTGMGSRGMGSTVGSGGSMTLSQASNLRASAPARGGTNLAKSPRGTNIPSNSNSGGINSGLALGGAGAFALGKSPANNNQANANSDNENSSTTGASNPANATAESRGDSGAAVGSKKPIQRLGDDVQGEPYISGAQMDPNNKKMANSTSSKQTSTNASTKQKTKNATNSKQPANSKKSVSSPNQLTGKS